MIIRGRPARALDPPVAPGLCAAHTGRVERSWSGPGLSGRSAAPGPARPLDRPTLPADVGLPVAAVAQRLGVAPATLRTWARRYGLGPTSHVAGAHRRYGAADLRRLAVMRRLTMEGVAPADAARSALASTDDVTPSSSDRSDDIPSARPLRAVARPARQVEHQRHPAGPSARPRAAQPPWGQESDRAAVALDPAQTARTVTTAFDGLGLIEGWEQVVGPALMALSRAWETTGPGYDSELMLTSAVLAALRARTVPAPVAARPALLAPAEDERDTLVLHVVAAALAERGVPSRVLAPGRPREAMAAAVRSTDPAGVMVLASSPVRDPGQLSALPPLGPATCLVLVGAGWAAAGASRGSGASGAPGVRGPAVPATATVVRSLHDGVDLVAGCALQGPGAC